MKIKGKTLDEIINELFPINMEEVADLLFKDYPIIEDLSFENPPITKKYSSNKEIEPCPFCGGTAKLVKHYESVDGRSGDHPAYIICNNCNAQVSNTYEEEKSIAAQYNWRGYLSDNKEVWNKIHLNVINKWNRK